MREETIVVWGLGSFWLVVSLWLFAYVSTKGRKEQNETKKNALYALGGTHLFAPTLIGGYSWALPVPATYAIYGYLLSIPLEQIFFFRRKDMAWGIGISFASLLVTFCLFFGVIALIRKLKSEPAATGQRR